MRYTVRTPEAGYTGMVGRVGFGDGVAVVDESTNAAELTYFRNAGYHVEPVEPAGEAAEAAALPPRRSASTQDWRAYAVSQGMPAVDADALSRDQLVERFAQAGTEEETS